MDARPKRTKKIISMIFLNLLCVLLAALIFVTQSRALFEGKINTDKAYMHVMAEIEGIAHADPRIVDIGMLASHNANTYALSDFSELCGLSDSAGMQILGQSAGGLMYRYSKNQASDIYDQLCQGARLLQFRSSYHNGVLCGSHTAIDLPMSHYIKDVLRFLQSVDGEVVVLEFRLLWMEDYHLAHAAKDLFDVEYNGQTLKDYVCYENVPLGELTYGQVTQNGKRSGVVMVFDIGRAEATLGYDYVYDLHSDFDGKIYAGLTYIPYWEWKSIVLTQLYESYMDMSRKADGLNAFCDDMLLQPERSFNNIRILQIQGSPTARDLFETMGAWSLLSYANKTNPYMIDHPDFDKWMKFMPVVMCDFVTSAEQDFNKRINQKITAYNRDLVQNLLA